MNIILKCKLYRSISIDSGLINIGIHAYHLRIIIYNDHIIPIGSEVATSIEGCYHEEELINCVSIKYEHENKINTLAVVISAILEAIGVAIDVLTALISARDSSSIDSA